LTSPDTKVIRLLSNIYILVHGDLETLLVTTSFVLLLLWEPNYPFDYRYTSFSAPTGTQLLFQLPLTPIFLINRH
jgi:hypothetical protein